MSNEERDNIDPILDRAISEVRNEPIDPAVVSGAAGRVWAKISAQAAAEPSQNTETLRTCADYQALIPAYRESRLPAGRALLVEDHLHECAACRNWTGKRPAVVAMPAKRPASPVWKWAVAAAMVVGVGISSYFAYDRLTAPNASATVAAVDGSLYQVSAGTTLPVRSAISRGELIRTGKGSGAVIRLDDGSQVELRERTELSLSSRSDGVSVDLAGGSVIVQAAKQRRGHLYVVTPDCRVSVVGTVFSVDHGIKGSRVAVLEGQVQVAAGGRVSMLHPGEQKATAAAGTQTPIKDQIAWSRNFERHAALLNALAKVQKSIEATPGAGLRYSSKLLPLVPAGTVLYAAVPNLGPTITQAATIFQQQVQQSPVLAQWWAEESKSGHTAKINEALDRIRAFSDYLGTEVAVAVAPGAREKHGAPVVLAEVTRVGLRGFIEQEIAKSAEAKTHVRIIDDPARATSTGKEMLIYLGGNYLAASPDLEQLRAVAALITSPSSSAFAKTDFHSRIAAAYTQGADWLLCADAASMIAIKPKTPEAEKSGFTDIRYVVVERKTVEGRSESHASVSFSQPRRGIASWLAAPGPMRSLDYISPDAGFASAALAKNPAKMLEDLSDISKGNVTSGIAAVQMFTGVNLRTDLVELLGGEAAFAIDGPLLPVPSWKLILEVNDPAHFVATLEKLATAANSHDTQGKSAEPIRVERQTAGGRTYYVLSGGKPGITAQFTFDNGLMIAAPSRDLLDRALSYRSTGYTLARSAKFTALLPHDAQVSFSAMAFHNLGPIVAPLANSVKLTEEQRRAISAIAPADAPTLVLAYGGTDRIDIASAGSFFGFNMENMLTGQALKQLK